MIKIEGLVQGVGFRPFIFVCAEKFGIKGYVENRNDGVMIEAFAEEFAVYEFIEYIKVNSPAASEIFSLNLQEKDFCTYDDFVIQKSSSVSQAVTEISPDIAVCDSCLEDMLQQKHRIDYPFINCTCCGPRYSIIRTLPYDRDKTTMSEFEMCETCLKEYSDVYDRRFHAQPIACNNCGPVYKSENTEISSFEAILKHLRDIINSGGTFAIKGTGGFHLGCNAFDVNAVSKLREIKKRDGKPFAIMFRDISSLKERVYISKHEEKALSSWRRPIILLKVKENAGFPHGLFNDLDNVGVMLPYMPIHYMLFEQINIDALVMTSGNISKEPVIISNDYAVKAFTDKTNAVITYNRDIYNRVDDSVAFVVNNKERLLRRSRGYAPSPIRIKQDLEGIFAAGAELVNVFAIGKGEQAILSQHIGDLQNMETLEFYEETYSRMKELFLFDPKIAVCDMHPDYLSTKFAKKLGIKTIAVQHHHAHIASCMAENGVDEPVIGISLDGTGYGTDGNIWGGEFFVCDLNDFERKFHFEYLPLPGGDKATEEPWRIGISALHRTFGDALFEMDIDLVKKYENKAHLLVQAIDKKINSPLSSSAGRLFDAVSAILGLCCESEFHAQAPMLLEAVIDKSEIGIYNYAINGKIINFDEMFIDIIGDMARKTPISVISAKFHNTIIDICIRIISILSEETGIVTAAISGGTFQNRYILENLENKFKNSHIKLISQSKVPSNDGGIALGQLAIAGKRRELKCV